MVNTVFIDHHPRWKIGRWHNLLGLGVLDVIGVGLNFLRIINLPSSNRASTQPNLKTHIHRGAETTAPNTGIKTELGLEVCTQTMSS